ncbi:MAG: 3-deoxy-manno-octulosonate cytidylyltransferase [Deltaproteobacteria bacterium]|nr:3-deoxy-manno-octulosonate cytidylyltransferase [Deltaproteobacteria bacterium]
MGKIVCFIPARYSSSRFQGKPLADICGKPMIQHVYERVVRAGSLFFAAVATDDERIADAVRRFGGRAVMTASSHRSGTDRIAEAAGICGLDDDDIVVNVQGDQPLFTPIHIDEVIQPLLKDRTLPMATLVFRIQRSEEITHPHAVKAVFTAKGEALYFSRATIPFVRDKGIETAYFKHHGIYAYRRWFLDVFARLETGYLEHRESLEMLRALEHGYRIMVAETDHDSVEVDSPEELARVCDIVQGCGD